MSTTRGVITSITSNISTICGATSTCNCSDSSGGSVSTSDCYGLSIRITRGYGSIIRSRSTLVTVLF